MQRPRDPQARRDALTAAVIESIADVGIGRTTHRSVATRAGLPLGATTYYFPTLDDLVEAGLRRAAEIFDRDLTSWAERLAAAADPATELAAIAAEYAADAVPARLAYELSAAAMRDERLRPLAHRRLGGLREVLEAAFGRCAYAVGAVLDGAVLQALTTGVPVDREALASVVRRLTRTGDDREPLRRDRA
ncbi:TetR family transcriptional regulator [Hamadaea sp.]|uniref:TetR/AcrR family transcriptional regulator n=1 Tax=Hamadaea sp. TaxID=2024425 RepID=UPI0025BCDA50|nr:TetR family transcriptional regulator [Hamadaea sp.]